MTWVFPEEREITRKRERELPILFECCKVAYRITVLNSVNAAWVCKWRASVWNQ